jgi:hypothetical protein
MHECFIFFSFRVSTLAASILAIYVASLRSLLTVSLSPLPEALSSYNQNLHSFADFSAYWQLLHGPYYIQCKFIEILIESISEF